MILLCQSRPNFILHFLVQVKTIYLANSFSWWYRRNWHGSYIMDEHECPGMPGLWGRCILAENFNSIASADATVLSAIYDVRSSSNKTLKFAYMLESPFVHSSSFTRNTDLMATYYRGSDINTPYGKWVYYDPTVRFKHQGAQQSLSRFYISRHQTMN